MISSYLMPFLKRCYPLVVDKTTRLFATSSKFLSNKKHVTSLVTSVYDQVKIYVVSDDVLCDKILDQCILNSTTPNGVKFIGLDCEWESQKKNGVALIQVSFGNHCLLYRPFMSDTFPQKLKQILEDQTVLKFGVGIDEDARRLSTYGLSVKGYVDLRNLAHRCLPPNYSHNEFSEEEDILKWTSLRSLALNTLHIRLNKSKRIQCGHWEADDLSNDQILYAAKDAIVSLEIFYVLVLMRKINRTSCAIMSDAFVNDVKDTSSSIDELFSDAETISRSLFIYSHKMDMMIEYGNTSSEIFSTKKPSDWLVDIARSLCQGIIELKHSNKNTQKPQKPNSMNKPCKVKEYRHQCRDKPLYENCFLKGPDGTTLATVNRSKATWYVNKNLGEVTCEDPFTVNLFFEPSGRPMPDADYYTTIKDNICVVCEGTESFVRKMIIPHDYRRYFPVELKDHMSHDVLLMCLDCHRIAQRWDEQMRQHLASKYNAHLGTKDQRMHLDNPQLTKVRSAAKALHLNRSKLPESRAEELLAILKAYCKDEELTDEVIERLSALDIKMKNQTYGEPHGQRVVNAFVHENRLPEFIRMWRQHFLDNMQPKHLPPMWSVEHNLDKLRAIKVTSV